MISSRREIQIRAEARQVWHTLIHIDAWPAWNPDIRWARTTGPLEVGREFLWGSGRLTVTSVVEELDFPHLLVWNGKTLGTRARHLWRLHQMEEGIRVETEESMSGPLVFLITLFRRGFLENSLERWLKFLKVRAEK